MKKHSKSFYTYSEALDLLIKKLEGEPNIKAFCKIHHINYTSLIALKNKKQTKDFPELIEKALNALGVPVELEYQKIYNLKKI